MDTNKYSLPEAEFVDLQEKRIVALSRAFTMENRFEIPALWQQYWETEWSLDGKRESAQFGVSYNAKPNGEFNYGVGTCVDPHPTKLPVGACEIVLSAGRYAVFKDRASVSTIPHAFDAIFNQWLPESSVTQRNGAVFERYPTDEPGSPDSMAYEIYVPVNPVD